MGPFKSIAIAMFMLSSAAASAAPIFSEDFENGSDRWIANDGNPIAVTSDDGVCSTKYLRETVPVRGGRVRSDGASIPVTGGGDYCLSLFVRGSADTQPFTGVESYDGAGGYINEHWVIGGRAGADDGFGGMSVPTVSDDAWHWYATHFTVEDGAASLLVKVELYIDAAAGTADFDQIRLDAGPCAYEYTGPAQHQSCGGSTPICMADGSCGCSTDSDCGGATSGSICDASTHACVAGCRGSDGNGCAGGMICSSTTADAGQCSAWAPQPVPASGNMGMANAAMSPNPAIAPANPIDATGGATTSPNIGVAGTGGCSMSGATRGTAAAPIFFVMLAVFAHSVLRRRAVAIKRK